MNGFPRSDPKVSRTRFVFLFFTIGSFLLMTAGSLYIEMNPENPATGEFLISTAGPIFWVCCGAWILFNVFSYANSKR
jgi:hypothetical protein